MNLEVIHDFYALLNTFNTFMIKVLRKYCAGTATYEALKLVQTKIKQRRRRRCCMKTQHLSATYTHPLSCIDC